MSLPPALRASPPTLSPSIVHLSDGCGSMWASEKVVVMERAIRAYHWLEKWSDGGLAPQHPLAGVSPCVRTC